jgi:ABC-type antimicrobial peptide transport system permease subunit
VLREGLEPVVVGAIVGIAFAFGFARTVGSLLFQVNPYNPVLVGVAASTLLAVGIIACLLPARRAAAVEPMQALRRE